MRALGPYTVTIIKPTVVVDSRDHSIYFDWATPLVSTVRGCMLQPFLPSDKLQTEDDHDRDFAKSTWRVHTPVTADILALAPHDRLIIDGQTYEVYGHVQTWRRFSGAYSHAQIIVQLRTG